MLPRSQRLSSKAFEEVMKGGRVAHSLLFMARILPPAPAEAGPAAARAAGPARMSAVAPVKIAKTAVARNEARRRMYRAAAPLMKGVLAGYRIALFAKAAALTASESDMTADLRAFFVKMRIVR